MNKNKLTSKLEILAEKLISGTLLKSSIVNIGKNIAKEEANVNTIFVILIRLFFELIISDISSFVGFEEEYFLLKNKPSRLEVKSLTTNSTAKTIKIDTIDTEKTEILVISITFVSFNKCIIAKVTAKIKIEKGALTNSEIPHIFKLSANFRFDTRLKMKINDK